MQCKVNCHCKTNWPGANNRDWPTRLWRVEPYGAHIVKWLVVVARHGLALKLLPHFQIPLVCPNAWMSDAARLVIGTRNIERQTMFINGVVSKFRITSLAHGIPSVFQAAALYSDFAAG